MFFLKISNCIYSNKSNKKKGNALRTSPIKSILFSKRTSPDIPFFNSLYCKGTQASITVEASLAIPVFLFFIINILSMFDILAVHIQLESALHQTAKEMAVYGYAVDKLDENQMLSSTLGSITFSETYVRSQVNRILGKDYLDNSCIKNGSSGIIYSFSKIMKDDKIELCAVYRVEPKIPYIGFKGFTMITKCTARAFTGYDNTGSSFHNQEEEIVYITKTGNVYHRNKNCTHLKLSISQVNYKSVKNLRNHTGEKYKPCEKCGKGAGSAVYITEEGNRYHTTISCSGLKRTVDAVPISKVGNRGPCSRCGGN